LFLPVFHRGFAGFVVGARASLRDTCGCDFRDDIVVTIGRALHHAGADDVADGANPDDLLLHRFLLGRRHEIGHRQPLVVAANTRTFVTEVNAGHLQVLTLDVFPDIHLGPVGEREGAHVFAGIDARVVEVPDLGTLVLRIPLAKRIPKAEEPFLGAGLFLIAPRAADEAVELEFLGGGEQGGDLKAVAADLAGGGHGDARGDRILHLAHDQFAAEFLRATVPEFIQFGEVMAGVHVQERHRDVRRAEGLLGEAQEADGILAAREQDGGAFEFSRHFAHDVNAFRLEVLQVVEVIRVHQISSVCGGCQRR